MDKAEQARRQRPMDSAEVGRRAKQLMEAGELGPSGKARITMAEARFKVINTPVAPPIPRRDIKSPNAAPGRASTPGRFDSSEEE